MDTIEMENAHATLGGILRETQAAWTAALVRSGCTALLPCPFSEVIPLPEDTSEDDLPDWQARYELRNSRPPFESQRALKLLDFENLMDIHFLALEPDTSSPPAPAHDRPSSALPGEFSLLLCGCMIARFDIL